MKNKILDLIIIICFTIILIACFVYRELVFSTISYSLKVWVKTLIPSMFPMFVISDVLIIRNMPVFVKKMRADGIIPVL